MTLIVCWLAFPLVLAIVCAGLGLLLERACARRLQTSLLLPCGFALLILVTTLATLNSGTAGLATPATIVLALAGLVLGARRRAWRVSRAGVAVMLAVFAVGAAPVVLSGEATFAGYTQLDDISTYLGLASYAIDHGHDVSGLPPSTYEATLGNLAGGYPLGSFIPLPALEPLVGEDLAWLWQPYLTCVLALLAMSLWSLARPVVRDERLWAVAVFVATQPALLYAYLLQGAVKEVVAAALAALAAALAAELVSESGKGRLALPLGVAGAALFCDLDVGSVAYLGPLAVALAVVALVARRLPRRALVAGGAGLVALAALAAVLLAGSGFLSSAKLLLQGKSDIGNLFHPLDWKQLFGVWPSGDFRNGIGEGRWLALVLIGVVGVAAVLGIAWTVRRRLVGPPLLLATVVAALVGLATFGSSPWVDSKALAIASPAVLLVAVLGACLLVERRRVRVLGAVALAGIAGGVLWSNWLAYRDVKLAPRERLAELASIGERFAGGGPGMINEYEPYGARYFLRQIDPEAPAEYRRRVVPLRGGGYLGKDQWAPLDEFRLPAILVYRTIVVRRSPAEARPPAEYTLRWSGRYYDVWQRPDPPRTQVLSYSIFGDQRNAGARPPCGLVQRLAGVARAGGARLVAAVRAPAVIADLGQAERPAEWPFSPGPPGQLYPSFPGTATLRVAVPAAGVYDAWVQGSFGRGLSMSIDGQRVGSTRNQRSFAGQWIRFGSRSLVAGAHRVELRYPGGGLAPGTGQQPQTVGPLALVPRKPRARLVEVAPARARSLCAMPLDWLEVVKR
ncbi:MAG: hypothetical protein QOH76_3553 [Thermoleophilaceae bacterium]|nr:hypothetical protein [Thermoleophilaceae bacterium]